MSDKRSKVYPVPTLIFKQSRPPMGREAVEAHDEVGNPKTGPKRSGVVVQYKCRNPACHDMEGSRTTITEEHVRRFGHCACPNCGTQRGGGI